MRLFSLRALSLGVILTHTLLAGTAGAADIYLSGGGSDTAGAGTLGSPYRTLAKAAGIVNAGDTVWIMNGTYAPVALTRPGTSDTARITWKAYPGHTPELVSTAWNAIDVRASWQTIDGLTLTGNNDNVFLQDAEADYALANGSALYNGNGISLDNRNLTTKAHHLTVRNCVVRKFGGGGIAVNQADYTVLEYNKVYENAWYSRYGSSGMTIFTSNADQGSGYRNIVRGNTMWNNRGLVKWKQKGVYSDGNGFILDIAATDYTGRTLVTDNLSVGNGGSGMHSYQGRHADFVNNTTYMNGDKVFYPELYAQDSVDIKFYNNVSFARNGGAVNSNSGNTSVVYDYNVNYNGTVGAAGTHDVVGDPHFTAPGLNAGTADFRLLGNSVALDNGTSIAGVTSTLDLNKVARPAGPGIDRGAFEYNIVPRIVSALNASGKVGTAFSYTIGAYNYPSSFAASNLPAGLSVNTSTGVISGTPTTAGTKNTTVAATNTVGTGSAVVQIVIAP
jgi:hypothetical protein